MVHMTENNLAELGYAVIGEQALRLVGDDLTVERIAQLGDDELYAIGINRLQVSEQAQERYLDLGKKAAAQRWWVGKVFGEIKRRKNRHWFQWLNTKRLGSKRRTIDDAILLSERMALERASELGLTEAMRDAGVWPEREAKDNKKDNDSTAEEESENDDNEGNQGDASAKEQEEQEPQPTLAASNRQKRQPRRMKKAVGPRLHKLDGQSDDSTETKPTKRTLPLLPDAEVSLPLIAPGHFVVTLKAGTTIHELHLTRQELEELYLAGCEEMTLDDDCKPDKLPDALAQ
jgi:hypothetical protein